MSTSDQENKGGPISIVPDGETSKWPKKETTYCHISEIGVLNATDLADMDKRITKQNVPDGFDPILFEQISNRVDETLDGNAPEIELDSKGDVVFSFPQEIKEKLWKQYCFITGKAGTGKSSLIRLEDEKHPHYIEKGSTTGIAAINCGGRTINSLLKYFNTESLERAYKSGQLHYRLRIIRANKRVLGIDEVSMLDAKQLDIIITALDDIAQDDISDPSRNGKVHNLGLHIVGDFLQLSPINAEFAFKSRYWDEYFAPNIIKLETIWRQDDEEFVNAINAMRVGDGKNATRLLKKAGVVFTSKLEAKFAGTTLIPNNRDVDTYNSKRLAELTSPLIRIQPIRRGSQAKEWDRNSRGEWGIPFEQRFKLGAYVMILRNDTKNFTYVNGDCGEIIGWDNITKIFGIKLVRNNQVVQIKMYTQYNLQHEQPNEGQFNSMFLPYEDTLTGCWVTGSIEWMPLRLAWASTIHKCLIPSTKIFSNRGIITLAELKIGDYVFEGSNKCEVLAKTRTYQQQIKIKTEFGNEITCSPEHKFPVYDLNGNLLEFKLAKDLSKNDRLKVSYAGEEDINESVDINLAWLLGVLIGDGSYTDERDGTVEVCCLDKEILYRCEQILKAYNIKFHYRKDGKGGYFISKWFRNFLIEKFDMDYILAKNKQIPIRIMQASKQARGEFLKGLFDTDGHINKYTIVLTTKSILLSKQTQIMLQSLGIISVQSEQYSWYKGDQYIYYQLRIPRIYHRLFQARVGFYHYKKMDKLVKQKNPKHNCLKKFTLGIAKISNIEKSELEVPMFDIEVSGNHLFCANGIVTHNSQGLSLDRVQVDSRPEFYGYPSMSYVAVSRARTPQGLIIIGNESDFAMKVKTNKEVLKWV